MSRIIDQSPDPKSHVKTLMRIGYTLNSAIADIVDNSIAANAKNIEIYSPPGLETPMISVIDDGHGMDIEELTQNMRIACKDPDEIREKGDLGRFGSGMKTASFSQARRLTVVTKRTGRPLVAARWDIDRIQDSNTWSLEIFEENEVADIAGVKLNSLINSGTQIIWSKLSFLDTGSHANDFDVDLAAKLAELKSYIALHFFRFMRGADKLTFRLNNDLIEPIDPFMTGESGYQEGPSERMRCKGGHIFIKTHVLPHFKKMNAARLEKLGGPEGVARDQGLYIFRERRLISAGGWMGISRSSQLGALARVQVDVPSSLDNDWSTDVKKASLQIPPKVKKELRKFLADPVKRSKRVYKYQGTLDTANLFWKICEDKNAKSITYQIDPDNRQLLGLIEKLRPTEKQMLVNYLKQLATALPINHIYEKMCERPRDVNQKEVDFEALEALLDQVFQN